MGRVVGIKDRPNKAVSGRRTGGRRKYRWRPRGLIGTILAVLIGLNLYVLLDNVVRYVRMQKQESDIKQQLEETDSQNRALKQESEWMRGDDYLREQAHKLGYVAPGETATAVAEEVPQGAQSPVKRNGSPSQPY